VIKIHVSNKKRTGKKLATLLKRKEKKKYAGSEYHSPQ
jgi:hypothetical protein